MGHNDLNVLARYHYLFMNLNFSLTAVSRQSLYLRQNGRLQEQVTYVYWLIVMKAKAASLLTSIFTIHRIVNIKEPQKRINNKLSIQASASN